MRLRLLAGVVLLAMSLTEMKADVVKSWKFTLPHGNLEIYLLASPDGEYSLGLAPFDQRSAAPVVEQVEPLKKVLAELPSLGVDPQKLTYVGTRLFEDDVIEKLAYACVDSAEWRATMQREGRGKNELVVELLNKSGAFEPYNEAFKQYGIRARVTAAEKVFLMRFSTIPPRNDQDRAKARLLVPADAMLGMRFSPINATK